MTVTISELKEKFGPAHNVAPYGECLVIQGSEFDPDWEAELGDLGYACHFGDLDGHAVTFVQLKKAVAPGKVVYVPPVASKTVHGNEVKKMETVIVQEKKKYALKGPAWTEEDETELLKAYDGLVLEGQKYGSHEILAKLPQFKDRSVSAIEQKLKRLRKRRKGEAAAGSQVEQEEKVEQLDKVAKVADVQSEEKRLVNWTTDEVERFVRLWNENPMYKFLAAHFPNRTEIALRGKATELKKKGVIENSYIVKSKLAKKQPLKEAGEVKVEPVGNPSWKSAAWSEAETEIIVNCWNAGLRVEAIHVEVVKVSPHRSVKAVASEIARLQRKGVIKPRFKWKGAKAPSDASVTNDASAVKSEKSAETRPEAHSVEKEKIMFSILEERLILLSEGYESLSRSYVDLKTYFDAYAKMASAINEVYRDEINRLTAKYAILQKEIVEHKHAVSGEAMLPMEGSQ